MKKFGILIFLSIFFTLFVSSTAYAAMSTPTVETYDVNTKDIGMTSALLQGEIVKDGGYSILDYGFYYGQNINSLTNKISLGYAGTFKGKFSASISGLTKGTQYYYRAYAMNQVGEHTGSCHIFTTANETTVTPTPTLSPTNLKAPEIYTTVSSTVNKDTGSILVVWNSVDQNAYYQIAIREAATGKTIWTYGNSISSTNLTIGADVLSKFLAYNTTYYIFAIAYNGYSTSNESNYVYFTTNTNPVTTITPTPTVSTYAITGYVKYPNTQTPVVGAKIALNNSSDYTVYSDSNGYFTLKGVRAGGYLLTVSYSGYKNYSKWISSDRQEIALGNIWLQGYTISGFILDQNNKGIPNATVYINNKAKTYTTDSRGYYEFLDMQGGGTYHTISAEKNGYTIYPVSLGVTLNLNDEYNRNIVLNAQDNKLFYKNNEAKFTVYMSNIFLDGKVYSYVKNSQIIVVESKVYNINELRFYIDINKEIVTSKSIITNLEMLRFYNHMQQWNTFTADSIAQRIKDINSIISTMNQHIFSDSTLKGLLDTYSKVSKKAVNSIKNKKDAKYGNASKKMLNYLKKQVGDSTVEKIIGYIFENSKNSYNTADKQKKYIDNVLKYPNEIECFTNLSLALYYYEQVNNGIKTLNVYDSKSINSLINNYDLATKYYQVGMKFANASDIFTNSNDTFLDAWVNEFYDTSADTFYSSTDTVYDSSYSWISKFFEYTIFQKKWYDAKKNQKDLYGLYEGYTDLISDSVSNIVNNMSKLQIKSVE